MLALTVLITSWLTEMLFFLWRKSESLNNIFKGFSIVALTYLDCSAKIASMLSSKWPTEADWSNYLLPQKSDLEQTN